MVEVRATRLASEVLAGEGTSAGVTRVDVQVAADTTETAPVRVTRMAVEVLSTPPGSLSVTRVDVQVAAEASAAATEVQVTRLAAEVLASQALSAAITRVDVQVGALTEVSAPVRISRISLEALAREGTSRSVTPLDLADDAYIFLHNWATQAQLTSSFLNDVTYSPDSGAESRRGLGGKPSRTIEIEWLICDRDIPLERFEVMLRRMTEGRFQMPLYMDQAELGAAYGSGDSVLAVDTTQGRWFQGQRIAVVQLDASNQVDSFSWHIISSLTDSAITLSSTLGVDVASGSLVYPIMDCEATLEVAVEFITDRVARFTLECIEVPGSSQLPAVKADTPTGFDTLDGAPVWFEQPDWSTSVTRGRTRDGSVSSDGRASFVDLQSSRARVTHDYTVSGKRDAMWPVVEFFETRRGRLRSYWHIDIDSTFTPINVDPSGTFVSVSKLGTLAQFDVEFDYVGIVMNDGRVFVRQVDNIQEVLSVFRITMNTTITAGLATADIHRICRARRVRFGQDDLTEVWTHTNYCAIDLTQVEVLDETDYES